MNCYAGYENARNSFRCSKQLHYINAEYFTLIQILSTFQMLFKLLEIDQNLGFSDLLFCFEIKCYLHR